MKNHLQINPIKINPTLEIVFIKKIADNSKRSFIQKVLKSVAQQQAVNSNGNC